jgi:Coenzyme PQQ synthesis protein D (PqqD)
MQIERRDSSDLIVNGLPDGSKVIVDSRNEKVFALNPTAGAAWDACGSETTVAKVAEQMRRADATVTDELAEQAIQQLQEKELVRTSGLLRNASRRQVLAGLTAVALPLVVSMTMTEQRAFAAVANSGNQPGNGNNGNPFDFKNNLGNLPQAHVSHDTNDRIN